MKNEDIERKDRLVKVYRKIREAREALTKEYDAKYKELSTSMEAVENAMLELANAEGSIGFKTEFGTAFIETETTYSIADEAAFFTFVKECGELDFFQKRVKAETVKTYVKDNGGAIPPGLNVFSRKRMKVRAPAKSVKKTETQAAPSTNEE